jgi:hypothetical protein
MLTRFVWLIVAIALFPRVGVCWSDVDFQLDTTALDAAEPTDSANPKNMQLTERAWCAATVEAEPTPLSEGMPGIFLVQHRYFEPEFLPLTWYMIRQSASFSDVRDSKNFGSPIKFPSSPAPPRRLDGMCVAL